MPEISIIIPCYNVEKYLPRCLDSVLNQTFDNIEIICVDDASTDATLSVLSKYSNFDSRIQIVPLRTNGGQGNARNIGLTLAKGKYICFVDSDDSIDTSFVEDLYRSVVESDADLAMTKTRYINPDGSCPKEDDLSSLGEIDSFEQKINILPHGGPCNKIYRKSFLDTHKIQFPIGILWEDNPFTIAACYWSNRLVVVNGGCYNYFHNPKSSIHNPQKNLKRKKDCLTAISYIRELQNQFQLSAHAFETLSNFCIRNFITDRDLLDKDYYLSCSHLLGNNALLERKRKHAQKRFKEKLCLYFGVGAVLCSILFLI